MEDTNVVESSTVETDAASEEKPVVEEITSDVVLVSNEVPPVKIKDEDLNRLREIQVLVDNLSKYRQEMGRLVQLLGNMRDEANKTEVGLAESRKALAASYNLDKISSGQWVLDFERREFSRLDPSAPVIP